MRRRLKIDVLQGNHFARPCPAKTFEALALFERSVTEQLADASARL
jgi:EAL domain-containing protein (putative c-di-GMP-specific phosphodiesterase class I)